MKIVFIVTSLSTGGAEIMLLKLLKHLDRKRFDLQVISLRSKGEVGPSIEALDIPVVSLNMNPRQPNHLKFLKLIYLLRKMKPDLVQTWMYHADLLGGLAARFAGCMRVVWGLRNSNLDNKLNKYSTLIVVKSCALLSSCIPMKILTCSVQASKAHTDVGYRADKIMIIPNGFDLKQFQPDEFARIAFRLELGLKPETPLVGIVARFDLQKNHIGFIEAASIIQRELPDVHFIMAGSGVDENNSTLTKAIKEKSLDKCIHMLGRRDDMPHLMAALDILVSTSFGEAFPNVLGEAMSCEVPCVVTDVGDSAQIVGESGRIVKSGEMYELATQVIDLLLLSPQEKLALGRNARSTVQANYEIGYVTKQYESFYEHLTLLR